MGSPAVATPQKPDDFQFVRMMYQEHATQARQHETLRGVITTTLVTLASAIFGYAIKDGASAGSQAIALGILVCVISILGGALSARHYERNRLHTDIMKGYRKALEQAFPNTINKDYRTWHESKPENLFAGHYLRTHLLWRTVFLVTFAGGAWLILKGVGVIS